MRVGPLDEISVLRRRGSDTRALCGGNKLEVGGGEQPVRWWLSASQAEGSALRSESANTLILDFLVCRSVRNTCVLFKSPKPVVFAYGSPR